MEVQSTMIIILLLVCGSDYDSVTADQGKDIDPCGVCSWKSSLLLDTVTQQNSICVELTFEKK